MELSFAQAAALAPVGLGGIALAATIHDRAVGDAEIKMAGATGAAIASLSALTTFLLSLPAAHAHTHTLVALTAGTLWLAGRCRGDARLGAALLGAVGLVAGLSPLAGAALVPMVVVVVRRLFDDVRRTRAFSRAFVVLAIGMLAGVLVGGVPRFVAQPSSAHALAWLAWSTHGAGVAAVAVAILGLVLGFFGEAPRRALATTALLIIAGEISTGAFGPMSCLAVGVGIGIAFLEAAARVSRMNLRGTMALLAPLVFLVLAEPLSERLHSQEWAMPDLGPVPPHAPRVVSPRPTSTHSERGL